jgi:predicted nucleic acid-binding protein
VILLDTSGLLSALDESQRHHQECASLIGEASPPLLLSPFVLAEMDYLLMRHVGQHAQVALLDEVARGAYQLEPFAAADVARAKEVVEQYADLDVGLADASIVVLAERHFRAMRVERRRRFKVLPFDQ